MIDLDIAKNYININSDEDDIQINMLIKSAYMYLEGATSKDFSKEINEKADIFVLALVDDCYNNRGLSVEKGANKMKYIYKSILMQLQLECEANVYY